MDSGAAFCFLCFVFFLLASCAPKRVDIPTYEGADIREVLLEKEAVRAVEATFSLEFERDGGVMRGDAALLLTPDSLDLRVYSLGFLVAEVISNETGTRSDPPMDRNRLSMLVDGIRNSFFWWSVKEPSVDEEDDTFRISNSWRRLLVNKRTLMPEKQTIELDDGRQLTVFYEDPSLMEGGWFPSKMRILLSGQTLNLNIRSLSLTSSLR
jgi:hypothetical protein